MISSTRNLNDTFTNQSRNHPVEIEVEVSLLIYFIHRVDLRGSTVIIIIRHTKILAYRKGNLGLVVVLLREDNIICNAVARVPAEKKESSRVWIGLKDAYWVYKGCSFLSLSLEARLWCHAQKKPGNCHYCAYMCNYSPCNCIVLILLTYVLVPVG